MTTVQDELWALTWARRHIDADALADAAVRALDGRPLDFRSRVLVRDVLRGLQTYWGIDAYTQWERAQGLGAAAGELLRDDELGDARFHSLGERLMRPTTAETVKAYLRDLGTAVRQPVHITIGGSVSLILIEKLSRPTEDVDLVDEVPWEIRTSHTLVQELAERHGLLLTHFQSHYLPSGWAMRTWSLGRFGRLDVSVIDAYDVAAGKLFSRRTKDFEDLRTLLPQLDRAKLADRIARATSGLRAEPIPLQAAERNWYVLTGDPLPPAEVA
jgi:hypothetical protein